MKHWLALRGYGLVTWLAQPLLRRKLQRRALVEPGYGHAIEERFGHYGKGNHGNCDEGQQDIGGLGRVWLHAVSLGEARAAGILIEALRQAEPDVRLLLTHGTATGRAEGAKWLRQGDRQVWQPWDSAGAVARFLDHFQPRIGVLMETEVWPQLTAACAARGIPLVLANARLNHKSLAGALRMAWLARPAYSALAAVWAQSDADAQRLASLGARVQGVFGNLKFDAAPDANQLIEGRAWRTALGRPVVLLASARDGEELQLLDVLKQRRAAAGQATGLREAPEASRTSTAAEGSQPLEAPQAPQAPQASEASGTSEASDDSCVQWLIVPRHPQRFDDVAALIEAAGFTLARRSASAGVPVPADIWLGDSLGEMALYYGLADVALLGGSFEPLGGQNLIEASACGCPVLLGPSTFNFAGAAELALQAGAAQRVTDMQQAVQAALRLVAEAPRREAMGHAALAFASSNRGAASRTAAAVLALCAWAATA